MICSKTNNILAKKSSLLPNKENSFILKVSFLNQLLSFSEGVYDMDFSTSISPWVKGFNSSP